MATPNSERPVDLMMDLRERMIRIETLLSFRVDKDIEIDAAIVALKDRTASLETDNVVLRTQIKTLKWIGAAVIAIVTLAKDAILPLLH